MHLKKIIWNPAKFIKSYKKEIKVKKCGRPRKIKMEEDKKQEESEEKQES